jgi:hypothetical protein
MKPLVVRPLLIALLLAQTSFAQVDTGLTVEPTNMSPAAASLSVPPSPIAAILSPLNAVALPGTPVAVVAAPAVPERAALPAAAASPAAFEAVQAATPAHSASTAADESDDTSGAARGRSFFDAAAPAKKDGVGVWARIKGWAGLGDRVPAWPGSPGDDVRLGGRTYVLGYPLAEGAASHVWRSAGGDYVVKILNPNSAGGEAALLRTLKGSDIPHARLVAASADGRVMVKEHLDGPGAVELLGKGFSPHQREGWAELGAKMIRAGMSANLAPENLIWPRWGERWMIADANGVAGGAPDQVVGQLLSPAARRAGVDAGEFLSGLRGRLGPYSPAWAKTLSALRASPRFESDLAALAEHDRGLPAPPEVVFAPAAEPARFPDKLGAAGDAAKALGFDPLTNESRRALHTDDPGKTNTRVFAVEPEGHEPVAVKIAKWSIIRDELAVRRVIRRWFGRYFDTPSAFGVKAGADSSLVMEYKPGSRAYAANPLTREQRAALAVLVHAFGISDMNPGNVLFPPQGRPVLIDFEVALNRSTPNAGRIGDEGIALEMPWMSRFELNRAEDYQPAVRAWRALLSKPESSAALLDDFRAAGFSSDDAAELVEVVKRNTADLDWAIQNDVDFVNQFVALKNARARP